MPSIQHSLPHEFVYRYRKLIESWSFEKDGLWLRIALTPPFRSVKDRPTVAEVDLKIVVLRASRRGDTFYIHSATDEDGRLIAEHVKELRAAKEENER